MPGLDANISRNIFQEEKRYRRGIIQQGVPVVDADVNDDSKSTMVYLRRIIQNTMGDGYKNNGFQIKEVPDDEGYWPAGADRSNNFIICGSEDRGVEITENNASDAGSFFIDGLRCVLFGDVQFKTSYPFDSPSGINNVSQASVFPRVTDIEYDSGYTVIYDSAANYDEAANGGDGELAGRELVVMNGGSLGTQTIHHNTANAIYISGVDISDDVNVYDRYRILISPPTGIGSESIVNLDDTAKTFTISGDYSDVFYSGRVFVVSGSTGNDGTYTVDSSVYNSGPDETVITVNEDIPDDTADGNIEIRRDDAIYLNVYLDQINAEEDSTLYHSLETVVEAMIREQVVQEVFVREGVNNIGGFSNYTDSDGNVHYVVKLAELRRAPGVSDITEADTIINNYGQEFTVGDVSAFNIMGSAEYANNSSGSDNIPVHSVDGWPNIPDDYPDDAIYIARKEDDNSNDEGFYGVNGSREWYHLFSIEIEDAQDIPYTNNSGGTDSWLPPPMTNPTVDDSLSALSDGISSIQTYDIVIDRADYASDSDAGDAVGLAVGDSNIKSIFIKEGTYEFGDSDTISLESGDVIVGEPGVEFKWPSTSIGTACIYLGSGYVIIENIIFNVASGGSAGQVNGLVYGSNSHHLLINCHVANSAGYGFNLVQSVTDGDKANLIKCTASNCADTGFKSCENLESCVSYSNNNGFEECSHINGCKARLNDGVGFYNCDYISNCLSSASGQAGNYSGFTDCKYISTCKSEDNAKDGFESCNELSDCSADNNSNSGYEQCDSVCSCYSEGSVTYGFESCYSLSGCRAASEPTGFYNCYSLSACIVSNSGVGYDICKGLSACKAENCSANGFNDCERCSSCKAFSCDIGFSGSFNDGYSACIAENNDGDGFYQCACVTGCRSSDNGQGGSGDGFDDCRMVSGCDATSNNNDGFVDCIRVSACYAWNNTNGYNSCSYISASTAGNSSSDDWTGNTNKDDDSCN